MTVSRLKMDGARVRFCKLTQEEFVECCAA